MPDGGKMVKHSKYKSSVKVNEEIGNLKARAYDDQCKANCHKTIVFGWFSEPQLSSVANIAQLTGTDAVRLIGMIVKAATTARIHKTNCRQFAQHLKLIRNLLEQLKITELKSGPTPEKPNLRPDTKPENAPSGDKATETLNKDLRTRTLKEDKKDKSLDVGSNGSSLFTSATSISDLTKKDTCTYMKFRREELESVLPEGLPTGMLKEFNDSMRDALLIRQSFLDLRDNFRRVVDPTLQSNAKGVFFKLVYAPSLKQNKSRSRSSYLTSLSSHQNLNLYGSQLPLYGIHSTIGAKFFYWMRVILASNRGTVVELGITPIMTSGMVMQLLAGSKIIQVDNNVREDQALLNSAQKLLGILVAVGEAVPYVLSGMYGSVSQLGVGNAIRSHRRIASKGHHRSAEKKLSSKIWDEMVSNDEEEESEEEEEEEEDEEYFPGPLTKFQMPLKEALNSLRTSTKGKVLRNGRMRTTGND
ncbi:Protein transport protein Sec61 subunit alpha [Capsicum baccatum]|uniref:Protein transport protein Sec61 subunit alpha n=1 Tax=Capsicum baccatum TaxID=33114 RepID=A0A2G2WBJ7_CAPBA|nr:Protein transport protein Sec61 subunit alpha [Capsicum baccatum]